MTETDLQSKKDDSEGIIQPPLYIQSLIKKVAKYVVFKHNGSDFELKRIVFTRTIGDRGLRFLRSSHRFYPFYHQILNEYRANPPPDDQTTRVRKTRAPSTPPLEPPPPMISEVQVPEGISQKEVAIIELTAQFSVRYGFYFLLDLHVEDKDFAFTMSNHSHNGFYHGQVKKHAKLLERAPYGKSIMEGFLKHVKSRKEGEEEASSVDWTDFEATYFRNKDEEIGTNPFLVLGLPMFDDINYQVPQHYLEMVLPLIESLKQGISSPPLEEPEQKEQKVDEEGLVPEDEFLARYPDPLTITVFIPIYSEVSFKWKSRDFEVPSLSESVRNFKEKIADEIKYPAGKLKLIVGDGDAGFLNENKSLAYYNVGAGPERILSLSIRY